MYATLPCLITNKVAVMLQVMEGCLVAVSEKTTLEDRMWVIACSHTGHSRSTRPLLRNVLWTASEDRNWLRRPYIYGILWPQQTVVYSLSVYTYFLIYVSVLASLWILWVRILIPGTVCVYCKVYVLFGLQRNLGQSTEGMKSKQTNCAC